eukprot:TRINITY_DN2172_c0_g5_i1.p1 TRINITY_DN2172_c0_g5~~TRINITY_DN2172_c0_g5_i1.p1  ORF type:complete len:1329 (-),score=307.81 TRINITY_DN2172_c0_g5_i1:99-3497(-)
METFIYDEKRDIKLYRTGDLGRYSLQMGDGTVVFMGRTDFQLKIRGYRVEVSSIEAELNKHPMVQDCVVVGKKRSGSDETHLAAYIISDQTDADEYREYLNGTLPNYMVPNYYFFLQYFPYNANGKVDRKALPSLDDINIDDLVQPESAEEEEMLEIWKDILGARHLGVTEHFLQCGGHSLAITRVVSRIKSLYGVEISIADFNAHQTIRSLCKFIQSTGNSSKNKINVMNIAHAGFNSLSPLSHQQQYMYDHGLRTENQEAFTIPMVIETFGLIPDVVALHKALKLLIDKYQILRTVIGTDATNRPYQYILDKSEISDMWIKSVFDGRVHDTHEIVKSCQQLTNNISWDLKSGPLIKAKLYKDMKSEDNRSCLVFNIHHLVCDGLSLSILLEELVHFYRYSSGELEHVEFELPEELQYAYTSDQFNTSDFSIARHKLEQEFWEQKLSGVLPVLHFPLDYPPSNSRSFNGDKISFTIEPDTAAKLREQFGKSKYTIHEGLLASYVAMLHLYSNQDDIIIGTMVSGREESTSACIGYYANMIPLRFKVSGNLPFTKLMRQAKIVNQEALEYQYYPFINLVDFCETEDHGPWPIYQAMFQSHDMDGFAHINDFSNDVKVERISMENGRKTARALITAEVFYGASGEILVSIEYCTDLILPRTIEDFVKNWQVFLKRVKLFPNVKLNTRLKYKERSYLKNMQELHSTPKKRERLYSLTDVLHHNKKNSYFLVEFTQKVRSFLSIVKSKEQEWKDQGFIDKEIYERAYEAGVYGYNLPREYGGRDMDHIMYDRSVANVMEELGVLDVHLSYGPSLIAPYILKLGSADQKEKWLPGISTGRMIPALGITEPYGGSDVASTASTFRFSEDGESLIINGEKAWITHGYIFDLIVLFLKDPERNGITIVVVDINEVEDPENSIIRTELYDKVAFEGRDVCGLVFRNCIVPATSILGVRGYGMSYLHQFMIRERFMIACHAFSGAKTFLEASIQWTEKRMVGHNKLLSLQSVSHKLVDLKTDLIPLRTLLDSLVKDWENKDKWQPDLSAMLKFRCTEVHEKTISTTMQFFGGAGLLSSQIVGGSDSMNIFDYIPMPISRAFSVSRIQMVYGGANEALKDYVASQMIVYLDDYDYDAEDIKE